MQRVVIFLTKRKEKSILKARQPKEKNHTHTKAKRNRW